MIYNIVYKLPEAEIKHRRIIKVKQSVREEDLFMGDLKKKLMRFNR